MSTVVRRKQTEIAIGAGVLTAALVAAELTMWLLAPTEYFINKPNHQSTFYPSPDALPGLTDTVHVSFNSLGIRGPEIPPEPVMRVLALGASTTAQTFVDDKNIWTARLRKRLTEENFGKHVWVGAAGRSGTGVAEHKLQLEILLKQMPDIDLLLMMVGGIDATRALVRPGKNFQSEKKLYARAFAVRPRQSPELPLTRQSYTGGIWSRLVYFFRNGEAPHQHQDETGISIVEAQQHRQNAARIIDEFPDNLDELLVTYSKRLNELVDIAENHGVVVVFITQPSLYAPDLPENLERMIWSGQVRSRTGDNGGDQYFSARVLGETLDRFNGELLTVCQERNLMCIDLASALPKDASVFADQIHFNDSGSRQAGDKIFEALASLRMVHQSN